MVDKKIRGSKKGSREQQRKSTLSINNGGGNKK
jgi:hypothetical protein